MMKKFIKVLAVSLFAVSSNVSAQTDTLSITLPRAIEIALAENPTIKIAEKDIELKKIADTEAWQSLLPTLDGSLALSHSIKVAEIRTSMGTFKMGMDGTTTAQGGITLALPLFAPTVYQNMKLTKEDILLAQEKARASRLDLVKQVKKAYYSALLAKDSREVIEKGYKVSKQNFEVVNQKYEVGRVSEYDKLSAEVQMRSMKSSVTSAETGLSLALLQLKVLMGVTADVAIDINDDLRAYEHQLTLANVDAAELELDNNSTMRQLDMNRTILERTQKIIRTGFMPTAALALQEQYQSMSNDNWNIFGYRYSPSTTLSLSVNIPIFHANNWTKLKTNKMQIAQLADRREDTRRQLSMAVESYRMNMLKTITKLESDKENVRQADKAVTISAKRYEVGRGTVLELNQSETALTQAELTYNQGIYDYLSNKVDLEYTLGRDY